MNAVTKSLSLVRGPPRAVGGTLIRGMMRVLMPEGSVLPEQREGATFRAGVWLKVSPLLKGLFCSGITFEINLIVRGGFEANTHVRS
jgi:hypothetical protein